MLALTRKPSGAATTESPCDIHTDCAAGVPANSVEEDSRTARSVPPYSRVPVLSTTPPSARAMAWKP